MKNVLLLFRDDLSRATRNVITLIVLFGVVVIPSFFAWFNVLSSWNPFGNLDQLKVAVASSDAGYESDLFPMKINIGNQVISNLRANTDLDWVFTSPTEAVQGTESGEYYAAIVLPEGFSRAMLTFLSPGAEPTEIEYYTNQKLNALSPVITSEAATEISTQINQHFTETLTDVGLSVISTLAKNMESGENQATMQRLQAGMVRIASQLRSGAATADMFASLSAASKPLVRSSSRLTASAAAALRNGSNQLSRGVADARSLQGRLDTTMNALSDALSSSSTDLRELADRVRQIYSSLDDEAKSAAKELTSLAAQIDQQVSAYRTLRNALAKLARTSSDPGVRNALRLIVSQLDLAIESQQLLSDRVGAAAEALAKGGSGNAQARDEIIALIEDARKAIEAARNAYSQDLRPTLAELATTLTSISRNFAAVSNDLTATSNQLSGGSRALIGALSQTERTAHGIATDLNQSARQFDALAARLQAAIDSGDLSEIRAIIGPNPDVLAKAMATPVQLKTIPVYPVANFGTQMAPFYTVLGLWVGALLLSVLIRVDAERSALAVERPLSRTQEYFGRFAFFAVLAVLQSTLLYVGLIGFVGVRPAYPLLLILAGWVMSLVFSLITYTLVLSFGEAGKALAVFLLVIQISAGGGAYPIAVLPEWFQGISPFLPVTHATDAVRSALAGIYQFDYWISLGWLLLFIVPALLLGLVLRLPLIKFNDDLAQALESTKLM